MTELWKQPELQNMRPNREWRVETGIESARLVCKVVGRSLGRGLSKVEAVVLAEDQEEAKLLKVHDPHVFIVASFTQGSAGGRWVYAFDVESWTSDSTV